MGRWGARVATEVVTVAAYVALAALASQFVVLDTLTVWYPPAGLAMAMAAIRGWRAFPASAVGEVLVGVLLFGVLDDFGWLVVPNGLAYAAVYTVAGRRMADLGGTAPTVSWRRPLAIVLLGLAAPAIAATVGVGFQLLAGTTDLADAPRAVLVWALGDAVGAASLGVTIVTVAVRARRGGRWWAIPDVPTALSVVAALTPALLLGLLALAFDGVVPFAAAVLVPYLVLCVIGGVPAAGLAALPTSLAMTVVADRAVADDLLALTDLQLLQLIVIVSGLFVAMVVEERRELRLRLAQRERHLREAQVQARAGSFSWDVLNHDVRWSDGLFHLLGIPAGPTTIRTYLRFVVPDDRDAVVARLRAAIDEGRAYEATHRVVRGDGERLTVRATVRPRTFDGRVVEVVGTVSDVTAEETARLRLEEAVRRERAAAAAERDAHLAASEAAATIEHAERIKQALLIAVSHEVRTPLAVVRGIVETMQHPAVATGLEQHAHMVDQLDRQTRRLERVLTDLLDVDRIGRGVVEPKRRPTHVPSLIEAVVDTVDLEGDTLTVRVDEEVAEYPLDAAISARILEHLLLNAHRHAPGSPIEVAARPLDGALELRVEDRGPGIASLDRERALDAFTTGDRLRPKPSTGVGLYIVSQFAELQGGDVVVEERAGGGTSVRVRLPREGALVDHA